MNEWNIQARARSCEICGNSFANHQVFHTLLFDEKAGFRRLDVCDPCWQNENTASLRERQGFVSYWHGVYESPAPPADAIQKENAESLLRKLTELNDPRYAAAGYILAVMLERKRLLKIKDQVIRDGRRVFIYEQPKTGDVFTVGDPGLKLNELEQVQHDVADLLENGLPAGAAQHPQETSAGETLNAEAATTSAVPVPGEVISSPSPSSSADEIR